MKVRVRIEATVEVSGNDLKALKTANPLELVQTALMQGAKIRSSIEKATGPERRGGPEAAEQAEE